MAVNLDEKKPSKDKDIMTTKSSTSNNNSENSMDEKETTNKPVPEVKVNDTSDNIGDSTEEQKDNENKPSRDVQNSLSIKVPSNSASPQIVTSPSDIKAPSESSISPSLSPRSSKSVLKNVGKKIGNMIRNNSDNSSNTIPEQGDAATSDSTVQMQQEQQEQVVNDADNATPESTPEGLADNNNSTANATINNDEIQKKDDDKKGTPQTAPAKQRTNSLSKFANVKLFLTRTSSVLVEKLEEKFDELDKRIYPDIDVAENEANNRDVNVKRDESAINEREQLLENKDTSPVSSKGEITNGALQKAQSTQDIMADVGVALNERKEKLEGLAESSEKLSNHSSSFAEMAAQLRREQEQKNKSWKFW